jgi:hypothetical protein
MWSIDTPFIGRGRARRGKPTRWRSIERRELISSQLPRPECLRRHQNAPRSEWLTRREASRERSEDGACVASVGSCGPGPTCVPVRSVGRGNLIGRGLSDFAARRACSERSRRRSVLQGRLTAARPKRGTKPSPHRNIGSAPVAGLSEARFGLRTTTGRAIVTVSPSFATRFLPSLLAASALVEDGDSSLPPVESMGWS